MKKYAFGADIGGTTVKLGLFTVEGELLDKWEIPTRTGGEYDILQDVADSCREKMEQKGLSADTFAGKPAEQAFRLPRCRFCSAELPFFQVSL